MISPGTYVEYIQDKRLVSAVCLRQDKPGRIFVRNDKGREEKLAENKCMFSVSGFANPTEAYSDLHTRLQAASQEREELARQINTSELWELLSDEQPGKPWSIRELCELSLGPDTAANCSAVYRALDHDQIYFIRKGEGYLLRSTEQVQEILRCQQAEANNKLEHGIILKWLKQIWQNSPGTEPVAYAPECPEACKRTLDWFIDVALNGAESRRFKDVQAMLDELSITRKDAVFHLLVKSGTWGENENLLLHKYAVPLDFSEEILQNAQELKNAVDSLPADSWREDLRDLPCFTIDDASTTEIDDALSFEVLPGGGYRVGVHIADAANYVIPDSKVDSDAFHRATALYLPDLKVHMLPAVLADDACSLIANETRPAMSFIAEFDSEFNEVSSRMTPSLVKVAERLTYNQADAYIEQGRWSEYLALAKAILTQRKANGALTVPFPRVNVRLTSEGDIVIEREAPNGPAQTIVSEMMILANRMAGDYFFAHETPAIFRSQELPSKPIEDLEEYDPVKAYVSRRYLRKGTLGLTQARHNGLGLDHYVQITSPIRRYNDLLMQRQLKSMLTVGEPLYSAEQLQDLLAQTKQTVANADQIEKDRRNYWILRYLEKNMWKEFEAVVVANHPDKHIVQLCDCLQETDCPLVPGHPLPPGTRLHVRIELVWPRDHTVRVSPVLSDSEA